MLYKDCVGKFIRMYKVYYNNFWTNYDSRFHNLLFSKIFGVEVVEVANYLEADILCNSVNKNNPHLLDKKPWKFTFLITYENHYGWGSPSVDNLNLYSCIISSFSGLKNQIIFPYFLERVFDKGDIFSKVNTVPNKTICAVMRNGQSRFRNNFLNLLDKSTRVDYGGPYKNNMGSIVGGNHQDDELLKFYKQYKFVIAIENSKGDHYITEKIFNALKAGVIPIYWGSQNIGLYVNPKRFIHIKNESMDEMMRVVNLIQNMTDTEFNSMVSEPVLLNSGTELFMAKIQEIRNLLGL